MRYLYFLFSISILAPTVVIAGNTSSGSPSDYPVVSDRDKAEEDEIVVTKEGEIVIDPYAEIANLLDGKVLLGMYGFVRLEIVKEDNSLLIEEHSKCNAGGCIWHFPLSELEISIWENDWIDEDLTIQMGFNCRGDGEIEKWGDRKECGRRVDLDDNLYEDIAEGRRSVESFGRLQHIRRERGYGELIYYPGRTALWGDTGMITKTEMDMLKIAFDRLHDGNGNQQAGQKVQCYNWVSLGTFNMGSWINGNGRKTGGYVIGSNDELYDDDELRESYDHYHNGKIVLSSCEGAANDARDNAVSAMIRIGRQADDVENEKRRITDFYQDNLLKCQSHFERLHGKYKGRFCGDQQTTNRDMSIDADFEDN